MNLLVKQIAAGIKGDDTTAQAVKIARKCVSSVKSQIAALEAQEVDREDALETALEGLENAQFPVKSFSTGQDYVNSIQRAQSAYDEAEESLHATRESITYFKAIQKKHNSSVKK